MSVYTRTGDHGETDLPGGDRVAKDVPRLETIGTLDELSATLGLARAEPLPEQADQLLGRLQHALFAVMAELAAVDATKRRSRTLTTEDVKAVKRAIDQMQDTLQPLQQFILPTGNGAGAGLHLALSVCRRAERRLVSLLRADEAAISPGPTAYLNRLGDLLFVLARTVNRRAGCREVPWRKQS